MQITGVFPQIFFNNSGDKDKIRTIEQWGDNPWTSMESAFYGCTNLTISNPLIDIPNLSNVTFMASMFEGATSFNYDIGNWDTSNVVNMNYMFRDAISFDQDLSSWNIENVNSAIGMFQDVELSIDNYDAILIGWNSQNLQQGVTFSGGNSQYCAGASARANMIDTPENWDITDGGLAGPLIEEIENQETTGFFVFPEITGSNLTSNEAYYSQANGLGISYDEGDTIMYDTSVNYPIIFYVYDGSASCTSQDSFTVTILTSININAEFEPIDDVFATGTFTFPEISGTHTGNAAYFLGPSGQGTPYLPGDTISLSLIHI